MDIKQDDNKKQFPGAMIFYTSVGLYTEFDLSQNSKTYLRKLLSSDKTIDCFCMECGSHSVFSQIPPKENTGIFNEREYVSDDSIQNGIYEKEFLCSRNKSHKLVFFIRVQNGMISKVGQTPSFADIATSDILKYKNILGKHYNEYNKAVGLYAHGIGIGSFVYLRRIIENFLIKNAYDIASKSQGWEGSLYTGRVSDKIKILKGYLSDHLVENATIYGIVSKGIHDLTEDECKMYFPVVRKCLELIFDDLIAEKIKEQKQKELKEEVELINAKLKRS